MRAEIIETAKSFLGLTYDSNNNIIFVTDYYGKQINRKIAYCCMFAWDVLRMAGASEYFYGNKKTASCTILLSYYKKNFPDQVHKDINRCKPGDLVFYNFSNNGKSQHVGIFESKASANYLYAIEGNTSNTLLGSQDNGGYVMRKKRNVKKVVMAFVSFNMPEDNICPYTEPTETVKRGCKNKNDVGWVQWQLNRKGYTCDIDESFGKITEQKVKEFQADHHLTVDGKVGRITRGVLKA